MSTHKAMQKREIVAEIFRRLLAHYGPQNWWPGETPLEVMVGAILTQNTNWKQVEKAIARLKKEGKLSFEGLWHTPESELAELIRPAGYFRVKARRLRAWLEFLHSAYGGCLRAMAAEATEPLRRRLLQVKGIGKETADSMLLYGLEHPVCVVDTYTYRVFTRHHLCAEEADYDELQQIAGEAGPGTSEYYNEFHALMVCVGKDFCRPVPRCELCPLRDLHR